MQRALQRASLPIWHTEGFNRHPFVTFALPLSLGFGSDNESMDLKLTEDISEQDFISRLNKYLPEGIEAYALTEPVMKPGEISLAEFDITLSALFSSSEGIYEGLKAMLNEENIIVDKKTKSGIKPIDIKPSLDNIELEPIDSGAHIHIFLPAGSTVNINPMLLVSAAEKYMQKELYADIKRINVYNSDGEIFR